MSGPRAVGPAAAAGAAAAGTLPVTGSPTVAIVAAGLLLLITGLLLFRSARNRRVSG